MSVERGEIVTVNARTIDTFGRFLVTARQLHFVSDTKASAGGPGEAVQAGELLLSALACCALGLVQREARERNATLRAAAVEVHFERDPQDMTRYTTIRLAFMLEGVEQPLAQLLLDAFTGNCPIYNTLRRGGPIQATVTVRDGAVAAHATSFAKASE